MLHKSIARYITSVSLVFILLYSIIAFFIHEKANSNVKPLDLMRNSPNIIYGDSSLNPDFFELNTNNEGQALFLFDVPNINTEKYSHLKLSIDGLLNNFQVKLVVVTTESPDPVYLSLLQVDGSEQINVLKHEKNWIGDIQQIGLRILPQDHLGLSIANSMPIIVEKVVLMNANYYDNYSTLANYWLDYEAWNYSSINHLKSNKSLPLYAQSIVFILIWLSLSLLICVRFFKFKINTLYLFMTAWLFLELIFLHNTHSKVEWTSNVYNSKDDILLPDEGLYKLASQVKSLLGLESTKTIKIKNKKVLILSSNKYQRLRLIYHMLPVNSSFLDTVVDVDRQTFIKKGDYILSYDIVKKPLTAVNNILKFNNVVVKVSEVAKGNNFVIMQVIK